MPLAAPKPCRAIGCSTLVRDGTSRCAEHKQPVVGRYADRRRGSRHERGYGTDWDKTRLRIMARDCGLCQPCLAQGIVHEAHEVDHRIGKAQWKREQGTLQGCDDDSNLQAINRDCHREKTKAEAKAGRG